MVGRNYIKVFSHILVWAIMLVIPVYIMSRSEDIDYFIYVSYLIRTLILAILFYANYLFLIDKFLFNRQFVDYILLNLALMAILIGVQTILMDSLHPPMPPEHLNGSPKKFGPPKMLRTFSDYLLNFLVIGLSVAMKAIVRWHRDSINLEKIKTAQLEADLRNLRSQLNPHFLFNTLNNIYSLIPVAPAKAQDSVHRLSSLLRYLLYKNDQKFVPIDKELAFTKTYIDLMRLRLTSNVKLNVLIENKDSTDLIASLMFITLIENAFKHGVNSNGDSFIDIKILVEKGRVVLCTVENSLTNNEKTNVELKNSGIGIANLTKRLELLYPNKHEFRTEKGNESFFALLRIDF